MIEKVNLAEAFSRFEEAWSPKIAGEVNGMYVKLVKLRGEFVWHHHDVEDELFFVARGRFVMRLPERDVPVEQGEYIIIPHGVEHMPVADEECHVVLFEPNTTLNTGNVENERTLRTLGRIA